MSSSTRKSAMCNFETTPVLCVNCISARARVPGTLVHFIPTATMYVHDTEEVELASQSTSI